MVAGNNTKNKKLNILLIHPLFKYNKNHITMSAVMRPMGLAYLAAYLLEKMYDINIRILDAHALDLSLKQILKIVGKGKWDIIGLSYWTAQAPSAYQISSAIRKQDQGAIIAHGGIHASSCPEEALKYADYCIIGEGEETFREFAELISANKNPDKIKGIAYKKKNKVIISPSRELILDLDRLPFPALSLLPLKKYNTGVGENTMHVIGGEMLPIFGSRGCPYNCSFCVSPFMWNRRVRYRSPENVVEEMKSAIKLYKINKFHFWDDNLLLKPKFVEDLCSLIIKSGLKVYWTGLTRAEHINQYKYLLPLMKKAGCVGIEIGVESANPDTFKSISKGQSIEETKKAIISQRKAGLVPLYTSMSFNIGETIKGYYLQNEFLNEAFQDSKFAKIYLGQFATPYPKTRFFDEVKKEGVVLAEDWGDYTHFNINFIPNSLLEDIPKRNLKHPRLQDYYFILREEMECRYSEFPKTDSFFKKTKKIIKHIKMISYYYSLCNAKLTVEEIAKNIARHFSILLKDSLGFTAFVTDAFAQIGVIKAADTKEDIKVKSLVNLHYLIYFLRNLSTFPFRKLKIILGAG